MSAEGQAHDQAHASRQTRIAARRAAARESLEKRITPDEMDQAYGAVLRRHPDLTGDELARKARQTAAILRYASNGPAWTAGRGRT